MYFMFYVIKINYVLTLDWAHYILDPRSLPLGLTKQQAVTKIVHSLLFSCRDECERLKELSTLVSIFLRISFS